MPTWMVRGAATLGLIAGAACAPAEPIAETPADPPFSEAALALDRGEFADAARLAEPYARQGQVEAQMLLAGLHLSGRLEPADMEAGTRWLRAAAEQGDPKARTLLGVRLINGENMASDPEAGFELLTAAARDGNARANLLLGFMYQHGREVTPDPDAAARFYYRAAVIGDGEGVDRLRALSEANGEGASTYLGLLHRDGRLVERDLEKARALVEKDARAGHAFAQYTLSEAYGVGQGAERDLEAAYMWSSLAAAQFFPDADRRRDVWAQLMTPEQIESAQARSSAWQARSDGHDATAETSP